MTTNLKKVRGLSGPEQWLLVQAFLALPLAALGLCGFGFRRFQTWLEQVRPLPPRPEVRESHLEQALATARLVQAAARYSPFRPACLPQSLVLWWLLRRQGLAGELHIGVKPPQGYRLEAHAWVEFQGLVLNDSEDVARRFSLLYKEVIPRKAL